MPAFDQFWFVYLVVFSMVAFMLVLGIVGITDHDPTTPPAG